MTCDWIKDATMKEYIHTCEDFLYNRGQFSAQEVFNVTQRFRANTKLTGAANDIDVAPGVG